MHGSVPLDTNIVIALLAGEEPVVERVAQAESIFLSSMVVGELYYGAYRSGRPAANVARLEQLVASQAILVCDATTARHYGQLKQALRTQGRPIPENDLWIAASAVQHQLTLVSRDTHFTGIPEVTTVRW